MKDNEGVESFEAGVLRYFRYYFLFFDIMVERFSSRPQATTDLFYYDYAHGSSNFLDSDSISSGDSFVEDRPNQKSTDPNPAVPAQKITRKKKMTA